ncbi:hypothetical protein CPB84DRAFT_334652 [Gymnopilus junonius]|uniref:Uncharacterized protein n=1 Tax=Gymnopilus junonius TaxID=109634 RepID=A0A9P5TRA4_GYMJU|nr:hypothetical protein CPB84DRAFT_334652 [Gymnopilus junonius]
MSSYFINSSGRWATGTPVVDTIGSTDISCGDLVTSFGTTSLNNTSSDNDSSNLNTSSSSSPGANPTIIPEQGIASSGEKPKEKLHSLIIGGSIAASLLVLIILCSVAFYTWRRKRQPQAQTSHRITFEPKSPHATINNDFNPLVSSSFILPGLAAQTSITRQTHTPNPSLSSLPNTAPTVALSYHPMGGNSWTMNPLPTYLNNKPSLDLEEFDQSSGYANLPARSGGPSAKSLPGIAVFTRLHESKKKPISTANWPPLSVANADGDPEVFQHQDAGPVPIELPPPYPSYGSPS